MAQPTAQQIINAIKNMSASEKKAFSNALANAGINLGPSGNSGGFLSGKAGAAASSLKDSTISTATELVKALGEIDDLVNPFREMAQDIVASNEAQQSFFKAGYTGQMFDFSKSISAANKASRDLTGGLQNARAVMSGFGENSKILMVASQSMQESLMKTSAILNEAGFDIGEFSGILESAAFSFNMNEKEINSLTATLINVQREIPVTSGEFARNFRNAQQNFAYSADRMMDTFIDLQKMSTTTGVSFDSLMSAFSGPQMDTFQGSAEKAGRLNQILGKSAFNSMELLTMTESERATRVRDAIMNSGRSIEEMGKFELLALKDTIGLSSVEETRRFLRGESCN